MTADTLSYLQFGFIVAMCLAWAWSEARLHRSEARIARLEGARADLDREVGKVWTGLGAERTARLYGEEILGARLAPLERWVEERDGTEPSRATEYRIIEGVPALPGYAAPEQGGKTLRAHAPQGPGGVLPSGPGSTLVSERSGS